VSALRRTRARVALACALGVAAALLVSACGGSSAKLIPVADAGALQSDFETVEQAAESGDGDCSTTERALQKTEQDYSALPASVDAGLRDRLREGITKLHEDALRTCAQSTAKTGTTGTQGKTSTTKSTPAKTTPTTSTSSTQTTTGTTTTGTTTTGTTTPLEGGSGGGTTVPEETPGAGRGGGTGAGEAEEGAGVGQGGGAAGRGPNGTGPPGQQEGPK
jgi:hypothetical protein